MGGFRNRTGQAAGCQLLLGPVTEWRSGLTRRRFDPAGTSAEVPYVVRAVMAVEGGNIATSSVQTRIGL